MPTPRTVVALLPMKGHSERVPEKNFRPIAGKPLFRWVLDTLLSLEAVTRVIINTDARHLLEAHGVGVMDRVLIRDRRAEICGDGVSMNRVLEDDLVAVPADMYLMTHTTNPLLGADTVRRALAAYEAALVRDTADSLFSVTRYQTRFYRGDGSAVNHDPANLLRTQDLEPWYEENSNLYLFTPASFATTGARIGARPLLFDIPKTEAVDIDDWDDWRTAEALLIYRASHPPGGA